MSSTGTPSCDDERRAGAVLLLLSVKNDLDHAAAILDRCAESYALTCSDEYLAIALAALQDLADRLPSAVERLRKAAGEQAAREADEFIARVKEYRRRLGCA